MPSKLSPDRNKLFHGEGKGLQAPPKFEDLVAQRFVNVQQRNNESAKGSKGDAATYSHTASGDPKRLPAIVNQGASVEFVYGREASNDFQTRRTGPQIAPSFQDSVAPFSRNGQKNAKAIPLGTGEDTALYSKTAPGGRENLPVRDPSAGVIYGMASADTCRKPYSSGATYGIATNYQRVDRHQQSPKFAPVYGMASGNRQLKGFRESDNSGMVSGGIYELGSGQIISGSYDASIGQTSDAPLQSSTYEMFAHRIHKDQSQFVYSTRSEAYPESDVPCMMMNADCGIRPLNDLMQQEECLYDLEGYDLTGDIEGTWFNLKQGSNKRHLHKRPILVNDDDEMGDLDGDYDLTGEVRATWLLSPEVYMEGRRRPSFRGAQAHEAHGIAI